MPDLHPTMRRILQNIFSAALLSGVAARGADAPGALSLLKQIDQGFVQVFEKVAPSVVVIEAVKKDDDEETTDGRRFDFFLRDRDGGDADKEGAKEKFGPPRESRILQGTLPDSKAGVGRVASLPVICHLPSRGVPPIFTPLFL